MKKTESMYEMFCKFIGQDIIEQLENAKTESENKFYAELFNLKSKFVFQEIINEE